jgi:hypothetical protein
MMKVLKTSFRILKQTWQDLASPGQGDVLVVH